MKISISGIRGIYGKDLTLDHIIYYCKKFAKFLQYKGINAAVIGRDTRESSKIIYDVARATLLTFGINLYTLDVIPTPFLFRESRKYKAGVMITSSHNPLEWNGLKFIIEGRGLFEEELSLLLSMEDPKLDLSKEYNIIPTYIEDLLKLNIRSNAKVCIDTAGGSAKDYAKELLTRIGCNVYSIPYDMPGYPDPTTKDLVLLADLMSKNNCKLGFAYDLDGDRVVVMSNNTQLKPDLTLLLSLARSIDLNITNKFAVSIDTSLSIRDFVKSRGCSLVYSKVGEANLIKVMLENNIILGGEGSSGGFVYTRFNMCRDGLLSSALISTLDNSTIKECLELANRYYIIRDKVSISHNSDIISFIESKLERDSYFIDRIDGIKGYMDDNTWILIRASNTENAIRISIESDNRDKAKKLLNDYKSMIEEYDKKVV